MTTVSIVTPWHNTPELCGTYAPSVAGAQVVIVDNASQPEAAQLLRTMTDSLGGVYLRNEVNRKFSPANNQGYAYTTGEIVVFLNSDIAAPPVWIEQVRRDVLPDALYGPSLLHRMVDGWVLPYLEGFCIAATRGTWERIGLWPDNLPGLYWDDNIVCFRAMQAGVKLLRTDWPVVHFSNYTSQRTPGAYGESAGNYEIFADMVRRAYAR